MARSPDLRRSYDGALLGCQLTAWAFPQLLRTLTDEFAFRRISRIDVRVLPIQIERHWLERRQYFAASLCRLPRCNKRARLNIASA